MATDGLASYTIYEDDGSSLAYQQGTFAQTSVSCRVLEDFVTVEIEEQFDMYRPQREEYEIIVHVGGKTLQQRVKAGQGKIVIRLLSSPIPVAIRSRTMLYYVSMPKTNQG